MQFFLFADDTNIYYEAESPEKLELVINKELKKLQTNFIVFHPYNKPMKHKITLKFQKEVILEKNYIKYLGVMIDSMLTCHTQIENISKKISRGIGLLYKTQTFCKHENYENLLKTLYYSLIYPHLLYAIEVWGSADTSALNSLLVLQKRIVRLLSNSDTRLSDYSFPPSTPLFFREKLLT